MNQGDKSEPDDLELSIKFKIMGKMTSFESDTCQSLRKDNLCQLWQGTRQSHEGKHKGKPGQVD